MPSTLVHVAFAGLLGAALLGEEFDGRAVAVVMAAVVVPDLDTFAGLWVPGGHRAILHTLLFPLAVAALLAVEYRRPGSWLRARWGDRGRRIAWVSVAAIALAGIGPDLFTNGVNVLYPIHDEFLTVSGKLQLSTQRGVVQTFVEQPSVGTTEAVHYKTGVDPSPGGENGNVERTFHVLGSGFELLLTLVGFGVVAVRVWETRNR